MDAFSQLPEISQKKGGRRNDGSRRCNKKDEEERRSTVQGVASGRHPSSGVHVPAAKSVVTAGMVSSAERKRVFRIRKGDSEE
jgi:hypothetical protein